MKINLTAEGFARVVEAFKEATDGMNEEQVGKFMLEFDRMLVSVDKEINRILESGVVIDPLHKAGKLRLASGGVDREYKNTRDRRKRTRKNRD